MRAPVTLLLVLSLLVQSLPVFAQEAPSEALVTEIPVVEVPVVEPAAEEPTTPVETEDPVAPVEITEPIEVLQEPVADPIVTEPSSDATETPVEPAPEAAQTFTFESVASDLDTTTYIDVSGTISLPDGCEIQDASGTTHVFPTATTTEYLAVCALVEALDAEIISEVSVSSSSYGLFVSSINGVSAGVNEYWAIWINDGYANCGVSCQTLSTGDEIAFVRTAYDPVTYAETQLDRIEITVSSLVDTYNNVIVPDACSAADISGVTHTFPVGESLLGICALVAAVEEGYVDGYELTNASFGLFLSSLDAIPAGTNEYWAIWYNNGYATCGVSCQTLVTGDEIAFVRTAYDPATYEETQHERIALRVIGSAHVSTEDDGGTGGTGDNETNDSFDVAAAFSYLADAQESDGSIENDLVTDWSAIAFGAGGAPSEAKTLLKNYLKNEEVDVDTASDYIRHAMAMLALDLNPYSGGPEDYITPIVESFDGTQLGEDEYINDDIFSLFPLTHAGYSEDDQLIKDIVTFVLSQQQGDGSWADGVDMTAAAVQALEPLSSLPGVPEALTKAETYLRSQQESDGGFGDVFATTWAILAIHALGDDPSSWDKDGNNPLTYLAATQHEDGSVTTSSGTSSDAAWATAYAITAVKGTTWNELLDTVRRQEPTVESEDDGGSVEEPAGEVLGAEDAMVPEPLIPSFTFAETNEEAEPTRAEVAKAEQPADAVTEEAPLDPAPSELAASVIEAESTSWVMRTFSSLWEGILSFFRSIFS